MKPKDIQLIIVPDVHGRTFWEDVFDYNAEIVFLGDYLDPYEYEKIYPWDALENFVNILTFAKKNPNVHLLLGNHDLAYVKGKHVCHCRTDIVDYEEIRRLFDAHKDFFALAYDCTINEKKFFISHAGITLAWYQQHVDLFKKSFTETLNASYINQLYMDGLLDNVLAEVSRRRFGMAKSGSIVWADFYEHAGNEYEYATDVIQIVGHTQRLDSPTRLQQNYLVYGVDFRQCVYIDSQGNLCSLKTGEKYVFDAK